MLKEGVVDDIIQVGGECMAPYCARSLSLSEAVDLARARRDLPPGGKVWHGRAARGSCDEDRLRQCGLVRDPYQRFCIFNFQVVFRVLAFTGADRQRFGGCGRRWRYSG